MAASRLVLVAGALERWDESMGQKSEYDALVEKVSFALQEQAKKEVPGDLR